MGWRGEGRRGREDSSKAEPRRILVGEPFYLSPNTTVEVIALCGRNLDNSKLVSIGETKFWQKRLVTSVKPTAWDLADGRDRYLLEPGNEVQVDRNNPNQLELERLMAAQKLIQEDSVLRKFVDGSEEMELGAVLEVHVRKVEPSSS